MPVIVNGASKRVMTNGKMRTVALVNGKNRLEGGTPVEPFTYADAGVNFSVSIAGIVSLTFNATYTYTATYRDGHDFGVFTNNVPRNNNISITVPSQYSNAGEQVTGTERFVQPGADLADVNMVSITEGTLFTTSHRVRLTGEVINDGGSAVTRTGFYVYRGGTNSPRTVESNVWADVPTGSTSGTFTQQYSTTEADTIFSVIAYAVNGLGISISSNVIQYRTGSIVPPFTRNNWTGGVTVDRDGTVNVTLGNAASVRNFPANIGTYDSCGSRTVTVTGEVEVPGGYSNQGAFISVTRTPTQQAELSTFSFSSWNGTIRVARDGSTTIVTGNAARVVLNSVTPIGENPGAESRQVVANVTVTAPSSGFCNPSVILTDGNIVVNQPGLPPTPTSLNISPNTLNVSGGTLSANATWTQSGGEGGVGIVLFSNTAPEWLSSTHNNPNQTIFLAFQQNNTSSNRTGVLTYQTNDGFATDTITVTQLAPTDNHATTGTINSGIDIILPSNVTTTQLLVNSNGDFEVTENVAGWVLIQNTGSGNTFIRFSGNQNVSNRDRNGTIILRSTDGTTLDSINFIQRNESERL